MKTRIMDMPYSKYGVKCPYPMISPTRIVVHNTANDASAANEVKYMQSNDNQVSFHIAVDDKEAVIGLPLNRNAWHAGDGANGIGNRQGIAVEICYSKSGGTKFVKAEKNAAELIASLLMDYGLGIDAVTKHQDYSGKYCPHRTLDMGWERFLDMVRAHLPVGELPDDFTVDGLRIRRAKDFRLFWHDKAKYLKPDDKPERWCNANFFAGYRSSDGVFFTLPVGNFACDIDEKKVSPAAMKYLAPRIFNGTKLRWRVQDNQSKDFKGKAPSTLIVPARGVPYIAEVADLPANCKYAVSGVPVIRDGADVSWNGFAKKQGWVDSNCRAALHVFLGIRDGEIFVITGRTETYQMVRTSEVYKKLNRYFDNVIKLDGGGSMFCSDGASDPENRHINGMAAY